MSGTWDGPPPSEEAIRHMKDKYAAEFRRAKQVCAYCFSRPCSCAVDWVGDEGPVEVDSICWKCGSGIVGGAHIGRGRRVQRCPENPCDCLPGTGSRIGKPHTRGCISHLP